MECLAPGFVAAVRAWLASGRPVIATVARTRGGLIAEVLGEARSGLDALDVAAHPSLAAYILGVFATAGRRPATSLSGPGCSGGSRR